MLKEKSQMLPILRQLLPPDAVIDVGIGTGNGEVHQWRGWDIPLALLIDANPERVQWAEGWLKKNKGWQLATVLLADEAIQQTFFIASNQAESSVIAIEELQKIWRNLQLKEQKRLQTHCLQDILLSPSSQALREASCIWGVIDCLPALPVLKGAGGELKQWSVLWVRVVLRDVFSDSTQQSNSSLEAISDFLLPLGYRCVEVIEENHPALAYALFVQDWHKRYEVSILENTQIKKTQQEEAQQLQQNINAQTKKIEDYKKQIADFQQQLQERDYRQTLLDEEFVKAEAQIELIKDVLLREKSL